MKIGYLRVSTEDQRPDRQIDALTPICDDLFIEKLSATASHRPVYEEAISVLQGGDTFVILDLDRAFRSAKDALNQLDRLRERGIEIQIVKLNIDTSTPQGKFVYTITSGLAEFERDLLSQRTKQGLQAARKRGARLGRPKKMTNRQVREAKQKLDAKEASVCELAALHGVHPWTLTRNINELKGS